MQIQKYEYLEKENSFLDEIKNIFHNYLKVIVWRKNEKQRTQALKKKKGFPSGTLLKILT